ncbi:MAG: class I SAM-dependent methyltransferase [Planctomycetota bacterium]|jgi:23S rRNA (cytosine1962-C5)-methyltransferase
MNPQQIAIRLVAALFEDEHYLIVNKPAGLRATPATPGDTGGLELIGSLYGGTELQRVRPLDQHVSGVLVLARSPEAAANLTDSRQAPSMPTEYIAVVRGRVKQKRPGGRAGGKVRAAPWDVKPIRRGKDLTLIRFRHDAPRTAEIRADLQTTLGLVTLGDVPRSRQGSRHRPGGRLFLHRTQIQFRHPYTNKTITVKAPMPPVFNAALTAADLIEDTLEIALASRLGCLLIRQTDALRLTGAHGEGTPGLVAERLGTVIILQTHQGRFVGDVDRVRRIAKWYARTFKAQAVYHKRFVKSRSRSKGEAPELRDPHPLVGRPCAEEIVVGEHGMRFVVRPYDGYSTGLFLDQRDNRRRVRELAAGRRVLNTFAYTCAFSVAAAAGRAAATVSVDLSRKALDWGKRNFQANGLDLQNHTFICSEVFEYLKRAQRQKRIFDLIILDPPSFARSRRPARVFSLVADLRPLLAEALAVLAPGGIILLSTNARTRSLPWLRGQIAAAAAEDGRRFQIAATPPLPDDFAADKDYAKTIIARFP